MNPLLDSLARNTGGYFTRYSHIFRTPLLVKNRPVLFAKLSNKVYCVVCQLRLLDDLSDATDSSRVDKWSHHDVKSDRVTLARALWVIPRRPQKHKHWRTGNYCERTQNGRVQAKDWHEKR